MSTRSLTKRTAVANPWTARIITAFGEQFRAIIKVGRLLLQAKADLPHGEFLAMVEKDLPFGPRYAQMLMRVAADPRLNAKHASLLPASVVTLHTLSRLDDVSFKRALNRGVINPEMDRHAACGLLVKAKTIARAKKAADQNLPGATSLWLVDPPWRTSFPVPYRTMTLQAVRDLRLGPNGKASRDPRHPTIAEASAPCAACAIWSPDELLFEAESVLGSWGFSMLGRIVWDKHSHSRAGRAALMQHEFLSIGVRGGAVAVWKPKSVVTCPRGNLRHSEKPAEFHEILKKMFPLFVDRCEVFARTRRDGWQGWGNQYPAKSAPSAPPPRAVQK